MARTVVATGGTGALGSCVVEAFLRAGDRVFVPWIEKREYEAACSRFGEALRAGSLTLIEADVAEESGAGEVARSAGQAEVLVNGVGGFGGGSPLHATALELWDQMFRINVRTAVAMSRALLPGMLTLRRGAIVNVASRAADERPAGLAAYSASKAAVAVLTETLQKEVAASDVRVNAVVPTTIDTPANREAMPDADFSTWTPPERIAEVILWLASDAAAAVRGGLIPV